jgi:hypothetical protein
MKADIESEKNEMVSKPLSFVPRTELGERLLALRNKIIAGGEPLLDWEAVEKEVADRRGGHSDDTV